MEYVVDDEDVVVEDDVIEPLVEVVELEEVVVIVVDADGIVPLDALCEEAAILEVEELVDAFSLAAVMELRLILTALDVVFVDPPVVVAFVPLVPCVLAIGLSPRLTTNISDTAATKKIKMMAVAAEEMPFDFCLQSSK